MFQIITNPNRYSITIMLDHDNNRYILRDYTLGANLKVGGGYHADTYVRNRLIRLHEELADRIMFDSEYGCFFAYAESERDALELAEFISELVLDVNPGATVGTMRDSPAFFSASA